MRHSRFFARLFINTHTQGDHSPDNVKFPDNSLTVRSTRHVKCYSYYAHTGGNSFRQSLKTFLFAAYWCIQRIRGFTSMRYINRLFTYLLTSAVWCIHAFCNYSFFVAKSQLTELQDLMYFMIYIWTPFYADTWYLYSSSVCPSVRHILVLYQNDLRYRHNFFTTR